MSPPHHIFLQILITYLLGNVFIKYKEELHIDQSPATNSDFFFSYFFYAGSWSGLSGMHRSVYVQPFSFLHENSIITNIDEKDVYIAKGDIYLW